MSSVTLKPFFFCSNYPKQLLPRGPANRTELGFDRRALDRKRQSCITRPPVQEIVESPVMTDWLDTLERRVPILHQWVLPTSPDFTFHTEPQSSHKDNSRRAKPPGTSNVHERPGLYHKGAATNASEANRHKRSATCERSDRLHSGKQSR